MLRVAAAAAFPQTRPDASVVVMRNGRVGEAFEAVLRGVYRYVLLDCRLPDKNGLPLPTLVCTQPLATTAIVLTALNDIPEQSAG